MNRGADIWNSSVRSFPLVRICRTRSGSWNGSPLRKRSLINEKIAVLRPIPSASVRTATRVNPGDLRTWRRANFRSFISFGAERYRRIDATRATCWDEAGNQRHDADDQRNAQQSGEMKRGHVEKHALHRFSCQRRADQTEDGSGSEKAQA